MATATPMTAERLFDSQPSNIRCELINGKLRTLPFSGWRHGETVGALLVILGHHVMDNRLGMILGADPGFTISRDPDTVRAPDIAFIARENLPAELPKSAFWPGAPDLAVEVLSPNDKTGEVDDKIRAWLAAGTKLLWVVDPQLQSVTIYRSATDVVVKTAADVLEGGDVVAGFRTPIADIFPASA